VSAVLPLAQWSDLFSESAKEAISGAPSIAAAEARVARNGSAIEPEVDLQAILPTIGSPRGLAENAEFQALVSSLFHSTESVEYEETWDPEDDSEIRTLVIPTILAVEEAGSVLRDFRRSLRLADDRSVLADVATTLQFR